MINGIGSSSSYYSPGISNSTSALKQTEEKLFAAIDTDGDGSITQSEFSNFLNKSASSAGTDAPTQAAQSTLFGQISGGGDSISLAQLEANAGDLFSQLQSEIAAGKSSSTSTGATSSSLLTLLSQSAASLASTSNTANTGGTANSDNHSHHGHAGQGHGGSLIAQFMQQYQAAGATPTTAASTVSATA